MNQRWLRQADQVELERPPMPTRAAATHRRTAPAQVKADSDRTVTVVATDATVDRMGEVVEPAGAMLDAYRRNPVVLRDHDPCRPVARATDIALRGGRIEAVIEFPPAGQSALADETFDLVKAGVLNTVSIGFDPVETEPLDASVQYGPLRYLKWELLEISFVSIPANPSAMVIQRRFTTRLRAATEPAPTLAARLLDAASKSPMLAGAIASAEYRKAEEERIRRASDALGRQRP